MTKKTPQVQRKLWLTSIAALAIISLTGCSGHDTPALAVQEKKLPANHIRLRPESLQHLAIQPASHLIEGSTVWAPGRIAIRDDRVADMPAPATGRITVVHAKVGDIVKAGDALATMVSPEASRIRADDANARVELVVAQAEAQRQQALMDKGIGVEVEKALAEAKLRQAQNAVASAAQATAFLGDGQSDVIVLRAPRSGTIIARNATVGATVDPSKESLFRIGNPGELWVVAEVFESDISSAREGAAVQIEVPVAAGPLKGKVQRLSATVDQETRRSHAYIVLDQGNGVLRAGMLARVGIQVKRPAGLLIPLTAVLIKDGQSSIVYVQREPEVFEARVVVLGPPSNGSIPVLSGLSPDERIVVKGGLLLDGAAGQLL